MPSDNCRVVDTTTTSVSVAYIITKTLYYKAVTFIVATVALVMKSKSSYSHLSLS